jgi:hypothetical protein
VGFSKLYMSLKLVVELYVSGSIAMDSTKGFGQARRRRAATDAIGIAHHAFHKPQWSSVRLIGILLVGREVKHNF